MQLSGNIVDVNNRRIYSGIIHFENGIITDISEDSNHYSNFIIPGLIDSHIHIESSMLPPSEFARIASIHGTTTVVSDPHEIANVLGMTGIEYMIKDAKSVPFNFYFGAPSCVPATPFETSGSIITATDIEKLLTSDDILYLSEMMNYPGVINYLPFVVEKLELAKIYNKPIDGHAPGLTGADLAKYIKSGISTDHECVTLGEALEKINLGMKILIRNGSAAKNFDTLHSLISSHTKSVMFCSDDLHLDSFINGHINLLLKLAISLGHDIFDVFQACILNPIEHYKLKSGKLRIGDRADMVIIDNFESFNILQTYCNGILLAEDGKSLINKRLVDPVNNICKYDISPEDIRIPAKSNKINAIEVIDREIVTNRIVVTPFVNNGLVESDVENDILKLCLINRYKKSKPAVGFIKNINLKKGALASSVAHDSHNIIAVGCTDSEICTAINEVMRNGGGLVAVEDKNIYSLPLPIAGLMSDKPFEEVAENYKFIENKAKELGCQSESIFMTLSFMALIVIPSLKLSDLGLFDSEKFEFTDLFVFD